MIKTNEFLSKSTDDIKIPLLSDNIKVFPSPYVYGGPKNQIPFFEELISMQIEASQNSIIGQNDSYIEFYRRLSLISDFEIDGVFHKTTQYELEKRRKIDKHWNTNYGPHGWHRYIGRFPPQVVRGILNYFGAKNEHVLLDPFCGSGTTLVEARLLNIPSIGIEICPLSALISRSKSRFITDITAIEEILDIFIHNYQVTCEKFTETNKVINHQLILNAEFNALENFPNIEKWFTTEALMGLSISLHHILQIKNNEIRDLFLLALSSCMRRIGNIDVDVVRAEYRKEPREKVDVSKLIQMKIRRFLSDIQLINNIHHNNLGSANSIQIIQEDIRKVKLKGQSVDFIITSPPYGVESSSYLRTHLLSYRILKSVLKEDPYDFGKSVIGSEYINENGDNLIKIPENLKNQDFITFFNSMIVSKNKKFAIRANQMIQFFIDMYQVSELFSIWLKPSGKVAFIIGNKKIGGEIIPTDAFIEKIFAMNGMILERKIQHKLKCNNSNSKVPWEERTIANEFILFFRKV